MARILVVEDSPTQAELLIALLEESGHQAASVRDGESALEALPRASFDLVISDVVMPGLSGYELCRRIKTLPDGNAIPVMLLTSLNEPMDIIRGLECGADNFLTKPYRRDHLLDRINRIIEHRKLRAGRRVDIGIDVVFLGKQITINSGKEQILDLLLTTFEDTVRANRELESKKQELADANEQLRREVAEREKAEERLRHAQKMEAVGQLTGGIAHDFNNLLTSLLGNLDLALSKNVEGDVKRLVSNAVRSGERAARLTSQLLAFGRRQTLRPRATDLNALIAGVQDMLAGTVTSAISVDFEPGKALWPAYADAAQIELALVNLTINARDAMPEGGTLKISTRNIAPRDAARTDDLPEAGDFVAIAVADTGTGMSDAVKAQAFEPFFTTKEVGKGSGLGLSMVYGLAKQLGGSVRIDSTLGKGTTVTLLLRRAAGNTVAAEAGESDEPRPAPSHAKPVLLVDDDPQVRETAAATLRQYGYTVIEAADAAAALRVLEGKSEIGIMVTDAIMPGMQGPALIAEALIRRPDMPVLMITGYRGSAPEIDPANRPYPVLLKPFRPAELVTMVAECGR